MDIKEISDRLMLLVCEEKNIEKVSDSDDLFDCIGFDSLNLVNFFVSIEEDFNIVLDESDLNPNKIRTIKEISEILERYLGA